MSATKLDRVFLGLMLINAIVAALVATYYLVSPSFLAVAYASRLSLIVGALAFIFFLSFYSYGLRAKKKWRLNVLPLALCVSALMAFLWFLAAKEPVLYLLHLASNKSQAQITETVVSNGQWARMCRNRLNFPSSRFSARLICRVPDSAMQGLEHGGRVVLTGQASRFGISVERFLYVK